MDKISFASGSLGSVPVLERVLKESISEVDPRILLGYADPLGLPELRRQIAELYENELTEENVMITSSAQQALGIVFDYLADEGRSDIFVQEPAYFGILRIFRRHQNAQVTPFEDLKTIENRLRSSESSVVYLTSNFHNPTGETLSPETKDCLARSAEDVDLVIVEDNPYDFLYFGEERPSNVFELAPKNTVYVSGFSKILGPGIRVGYVIADKETITKLKSGKISQDIFTSTLGQQICSGALRHSDYLAELRGYFRGKRDLALSCLSEQFGTESGFVWSRPEGGIFILGQFQEDVNGNEVAKIARDRYGLTLEKDKYTFSDGKSRNTTRINFVQNPDDLLREGVVRLYKSFKEVKNET
ncbi:MAG: aminotransferase-like domain-containing protein [Candidatus Heimdallarchaeaceae archaeon]